MGYGMRDEDGWECWRILVSFFLLLFCVLYTTFVGRYPVSTPIRFVVLLITLDCFKACHGIEHRNLLL